MARQRSRNTTPSSVPTAPTASLPPVETIQTEHLDLPFDLFRNLTYEDLVDQPASNAVIPDSKSLDGIIARLTRLQETIEKRGSFCDRGMRLLASNRRTRMDELAAERSREEERLRREAADDEERERKANKANKKKRKATENLAPQDTNTGQFRIIIFFYSWTHLVLGAGNLGDLHRCLTRILNISGHLPSTSYGSVNLPFARAIIPSSRVHQQRANTRQRLRILFTLTSRTCDTKCDGGRQAAQSRGE